MEYGAGVCGDGYQSGWGPGGCAGRECESGGGGEEGGEEELLADFRILKGFSARGKAERVDR